MTKPRFIGKNNMTRIEGMARVIVEIFARLDVKEGLTLEQLGEQVRDIVGERYELATYKLGFPYPACVSETATICHGVPNDRKIAGESIIKVDVVLQDGPFYVDASWAYVIGTRHRDL